MFILIHKETGAIMEFDSEKEMKDVLEKLNQDGKNSWIEDDDYGFIII